MTKNEPPQDEPPAAIGYFFLAAILISIGLFFNWYITSNTNQSSSFALPRILAFVYLFGGMWALVSLPMWCGGLLIVIGIISGIRSILSIGSRIRREREAVNHKNDKP